MADEKKYHGTTESPETATFRTSPTIVIGPSLGGTLPINTVTVTSIDPQTGDEAGGTAVTITGTGFLTGALVYFNGVLATSIIRVNATTITCVTPPGIEEAQIDVSNPSNWNGTLAAGDPDGYTYTVPSSVTVTSINSWNNQLSIYNNNNILDPLTGTNSINVGTKVIGTGFQTGLEILFAGVAATNVVFIDDMNATCDPPDGAGKANVLVVNLDSSSGVLTDGALYFGPVEGIANATSTPATSITVNGFSNPLDFRDVFFSFVATTVGSQTITPPAGFILIAEQLTTAPTMSLYYKISNGTEPGSYAWGCGSSADMNVCIINHRGVDRTAPIDTHSIGPATQASPNIQVEAPSIVTTVDNTSILGYNLSNDGTQYNLYTTDGLYQGYFGYNSSFFPTTLYISQYVNNFALWPPVYSPPGATGIVTFTRDSNPTNKASAGLLAIKHE